MFGKKKDESKEAPPLTPEQEQQLKQQAVAAVLQTQMVAELGVDEDGRPRDYPPHTQYSTHGWTVGWGANGRLGTGDLETRALPACVASHETIALCAAGNWHTLFLTERGQVLACGSSEAGQLGIGDDPIVPPGPSIEELEKAAAAERRAKKAVPATWKDYLAQQRAPPKPTPQVPVPPPRYADVLRPKAIPTLHSVKFVAAGLWSSYAVTRDGSLYAWGHNTRGQLGLGHQRTERTPQLVPTVRDVKVFAAGGEHALAVAGNGWLYVWGRGTEGQLGIGYALDQATPIRYPYARNTTIVNLAAGGQHSMAVVWTQDDVWLGMDVVPKVQVATVLVWGDNRHHQLGLPADHTILDFALETTGPVSDRVLAAQQAAAALEAEFASAESKRKAKMQAIQRSMSGLNALAAPAPAPAAMPLRLGSTNPAACSPDRKMIWLPQPLLFFVNKDPVTCAAGAEHSLVLCATDARIDEGRVYSFGAGSHGQLGVSDIIERSTPTEIRILRSRGVVEIAAGQRHSLARTVDGQVFAWGFGVFGEAGARMVRRSVAKSLTSQPPGTGIPEVNLTPAVVEPMRKFLVKRLSAGGRHSAFIAGLEPPSTNVRVVRKDLSKTYTVKAPSQCALFVGRPHTEAASQLQMRFACAPCKLDAVCRACARTCHRYVHGQHVRGFRMSLVVVQKSFRVDPLAT